MAHPGKDKKKDVFEYLNDKKSQDSTWKATWQPYQN